MKRQPQIDEIITFLEKKAPATIRAIRNENSSFHEILKEGAVLGDSDDIGELKVRAKICFAATDETIKRCREELVKLKRRLKTSQKIQLYGQVLTTISGASVLTSLATDHKNITYVGGFLSLLGALVPLIVDFQRSSLNRNKNLHDIYEELVKLIVEAQRNKQQLEYFINNSFNVDGISDVINRCNQLCLEIEERRLLS
jgi:hypothetical protein